MTGKELLKLAKKQGFEIYRITGSHHILKHKDGRLVPIPVHSNKDLHKGTLNTILKGLGLK